MQEQIDYLRILSKIENIIRFAYHIKANLIYLDRLTFFEYIHAKNPFNSIIENLASSNGT